MALIKKNDYGEHEAVIGLKDKNGNGFLSGFVEIKGQLYRIGISRTVGDKGAERGVEAWCTVTAKRKKGGYNQSRKGL